MAGEPADSRDRRDQDGAPRAALTPFVKRLIGTIRRECLDHVLFWNGRDLERKLTDFQDYYNTVHGHASLNGETPLGFSDGKVITPADLNHVRWVSHCCDLVQLPVAA